MCICYTLCGDVLSVVFFKHQTAYDVRISDWSSDVRSSDLPVVDPEEAEEEFGIKLVGADAMAGLDAIVFCVPHREILNALNPCPTKRLVDGGIFVDVK